MTPPSAPCEQSSRQVDALVAQAQAHRDRGEWEAAARSFAAAIEKRGEDPVLHHNLAMALHASGHHRKAVASAQAALQRAPSLWQSSALAARAYLALGEVENANASLTAVLAADPRNGMALLDRAGLLLNEFGDPGAARASVEPLLGDPRYAADAELTTIMSLLYDRVDLSAEAFTARAAAFSAANLRLPSATTATRVREGGRTRVIVMSPLFSSSPVFHFAYSTLAMLAGRADLLFVNRGLKRDWATERLHALASEWHEAAALDAPGLAALLASLDAGAVLDLGGWSDPVGLKALSAGVAPRLFKWVGGQSITTGLENVTGWIGDDWQCPPGSEHLYTEPLARVAGGYVDYTKPPAIEQALRALPSARRGVGLVGNPAKIGAALLRNWPDGAGEVVLIDRRYAFPRVRDRIGAMLGAKGIKIAATIVPTGHAEYLRELGKLEYAIITQPYSAGLTAAEALTLGVKLLSANRVGQIFSERHHLTHIATHGVNPKAPAAICRLVEGS